MEIRSNKEELQIEIIDLVNLFAMPEDFEVEHEEIEQNNKIINKFALKSTELKINKNFVFENKVDGNLNALKYKSKRKRFVKNNLYDAINAVTKKTLPWGSLTGIRPTKFARDMIESGEVKEYLLAETLEKDYRVSKNKARLTANILKHQKTIIRNDSLVDLYINIPICPTRCLYCSFISNELSRVQDKVETYIDCVIKELKAVREITAKRPYVIRNIYIGGGTPSVLTARQLDKLLSEINFSCNEFTVECGRADTITEEKLDVLKKHKVTRISINPQTFCETTLKRIGRKHKNIDVFNAYSLALQKGFIVNMDLIAGLPGERFAIFKRTMSTVLELYPDNVTIHTLSIKNGALLKDNMTDVTDRDVEKMVDYSEKILTENGYKPYYMYRQKNQLKGLENVGYYRDESVCVFNIDSMEETNSVIAVGAGAMSKRVFNLENRIERLHNVKFIEDYIARIDEMIDKKKSFF